jgi:hypothetical protein
MRGKNYKPKSWIHTKLVKGITLTISHSDKKAKNNPKKIVHSNFPLQGLNNSM